MKAILQALRIICRAEAKVRKLLVSSAGSGDYETVSRLLDLVRQLRRLAEQLDLNRSLVARPAAGESHETGDGSLTSSVDVSSTPSATTHGPPRLADTKRSNTKAKSEYPRFYRERDELVKIGWSKKQRAEYRHRAPKSVVVSVAESLQKRGTGGERFTIEEFLPFRDRDSQAELPSYQAYLTLAWLRKENLIVQHGRKGYSLPPNINLMDALEERWKQLPKV